MSETLHIKQGRLVGVRTSIFTIFNPEKYDASAIPTAWKEFFSKAAQSELVKTESFYGASIPSMSLDAPMDYFAGVIIDSNSDVPAGFESVEIPEGDYLAVDHVGPITNIAASYQRAYMEILPTAGMEMRPAPHLEVYNSEKNPMDPDYRMLIAIPIK